MSIKLLENISVQTNMPLDDRSIVQSLALRDSISASLRYIGMEVYVLDTHKKYRLTNGVNNDSWVELSHNKLLSEMISTSSHQTVSATEKSTWNSKANAVHNHKMSEMLTDATHQFVSQAEKNTWNGKADVKHSHNLLDMTSDSMHQLVTQTEKNTWNGKANAVHTHSDIDAKIKKITDDIAKLNMDIKNVVPVPVGGILTMYLGTNPAELYSGTTWEALPDGKFIKTGATPLQQAGSNLVTITKANLPADKLQVESFSLTRGTMDITGTFEAYSSYNLNNNDYWVSAAKGAFYKNPSDYFEEASNGNQVAGATGDSTRRISFGASRAWTGNTSSASPYTTVMGSGNPITINPEHITLKMWKRLT